eukprot:2508584-Pleurochrysis_carterae.AAC.1
MPQVEAVSGREDDAALNDASRDARAPVGDLADSKGAIVHWTFMYTLHIYRLDIALSLTAL